MELAGLEQCAEDSVPHAQLQKKIRSILHKLRSNRSSWPFVEPVNAKEVPEYYVYIKFPIDLKRINERCKKKYYVHERDINCHARPCAAYGYVKISARKLLIRE
ncbi:unnamed protein product [Gongylonema pulchrum]|uniref:Bromo domain-containing protein n=1 Tax=Gongylonema pulchrum TaxID=637853 RepID=A0A183ET69_9BILA|nr:unnamed protein product [Gongylonema pulchrum]